MQGGAPRGGSAPGGSAQGSGGQKLFEQATTSPESSHTQLTQQIEPSGYVVHLGQEWVFAASARGFDKPAAEASSRARSNIFLRIGSPPFEKPVHYLLNRPLSGVPRQAWVATAPPSSP